MSIISSDVHKAAEILNNEEVVAIPTETVYGLAGNIYSQKAVRRIFDVKQRPLFNPLIVHISAKEKMLEIAQNIPDRALKLAEAFWPGSLTLLLDKNTSIPDIITAGKGTVAIRVPDHPIALELLQIIHFPLAAPSANPFGSISPTKASHVEAYFGHKISMILEGGVCRNGLESTIIGFENDVPIIYRLGAISVEEIEKVVGKTIVKNKKESSPNAPGMLERHYAPSTKTYLVEDAKAFIRSHKDKKIGLIVFSDTGVIDDNIQIETLSKSGDLKEAAAQLYQALHTLDTLPLDMIVAERFPDYGLGKTINDRLERATKDK